MLGTLVTLISVFLSVGVAVSVEAYFKSTGKGVPEGLREFTDGVFNQTFTPSLVGFLGVSVGYGLLKQSQLRSGEAQYKEDGDE